MDVVAELSQSRAWNRGFKALTNAENHPFLPWSKGHFPKVLSTSSTSFGYKLRGFYS